jgi:hypothetical protein
MAAVIEKHAVEKYEFPISTQVTQFCSKLKLRGRKFLQRQLRMGSSVLLHQLNATKRQFLTEIR